MLYFISSLLAIALDFVRLELKFSLLFFGNQSLPNYTKSLAKLIWILYENFIKIGPAIFEFIENIHIHMDSSILAY